MNEPPIRIAYADDHTIVRKGIISIINSFEKFVVEIEAGNGKALIEKIKKAPQLPDICLLDICMPELNGYDATIEIKKLWPDMKVVVLTAFDNDYSVVKMIASGANGYLLKNANVDELQKALHTVYTDSYYHSELLSHKFHSIVTSGQPAIPAISEKEMQLLNYCCTDLTYHQIAKEMRTTSRSVEGYRDSLFRKFGISSRTGLALLSLRLGVTRLS